jgi:OLD-like protein
MDAPDPLPRAVVLVEGVSDREAVLAAARSLGRDLVAEGVRVVALGGAGGVGRRVAELTAAGLGDRLRGLYDVGEEGFFRRALGAADGDELAARGFSACVTDLEEELVRAAGVAGVEAVVAAQREARALETFRAQPAQRGRSPEAQLRRFLGTTSGRKARYARALVEHLEPGDVPPPLRHLLAAT